MISGMRLDHASIGQGPMPHRSSPRDIIPRARTVSYGRVPCAGCGCPVGIVLWACTPARRGHLMPRRTVRTSFAAPRRPRKEDTARKISGFVQIWWGPQTCDTGAIYERILDSPRNLTGHVATLRSRSHEQSGETTPPLYADPESSTQ